SAPSSVTVATEVRAGEGAKLTPAAQPVATGPLLVGSELPASATPLTPAHGEGVRLETRTGLVSPAYPTARVVEPGRPAPAAAALTAARSELAWQLTDSAQPAVDSADAEFAAPASGLPDEGVRGSMPVNQPAKVAPCVEPSVAE